MEDTRAERGGGAGETVMVVATAVVIAWLAAYHLRGFPYPLALDAAGHGASLTAAAPVQFTVLP